MPTVLGRERVSEDLARATRDASLSRGLGRSYGDASLPASPARPVVSTRLADRVLDFDLGSGVLRAEAGLTLAALNRIFWPRGFCAPVSPGTERVTLGGMVASDIHGKNHHAKGTFGRHVRALRLRVADGRALEIDDATEPELFRATLGGMGLTGHVLEVAVALEPIPSPWILCETLRLPDLDALLDALTGSGRDWPYTVAWLDTLAPARALGRGLLIRGRWADPTEAPAGAPGPGRSLPAPFRSPLRLVSRAPMRAFNALWLAWNGRRRGLRVVHPRAFFYPLDGVHDVYPAAFGPAGLVQYQCVVPAGGDRVAVRRILDHLRQPGAWSSLAVLKDFGAEGRGLVSFPRPGLTLALDFPMRGERTRALVDALNELVLEAGGRIYLSKDALSRPEHVRAMDPRLEAFQRVRAKWDPERRIRSAQSVRLLGDPA